MQRLRRHLQGAVVPQKEARAASVSASQPTHMAGTPISEAAIRLHSGLAMCSAGDAAVRPKSVGNVSGEVRAASGSPEPSPLNTPWRPCPWTRRPPTAMDPFVWTHPARSEPVCCLDSDPDRACSAGPDPTRHVTVTSAARPHCFDISDQIPKRRWNPTVSRDCGPALRAGSDMDGTTGRRLRRVRHARERDT
jgi:hypothetical protein